MYDFERAERPRLHWRIYAKSNANETYCTTDDPVRAGKIVAALNAQEAARYERLVPRRA